MRNFEKDNTVSAENQLPQEQRLTTANESAPYRVLFVGNSITRARPQAGYRLALGLGHGRFRR